MNSDNVKDMTFKVDAWWHTWLKKLSADAGMSMKAVFMQAVEEWAVRRFGMIILEKRQL